MLELKKYCFSRESCQKSWEHRWRLKITLLLETFNEKSAHFLPSRLEKKITERFNLIKISHPKPRAEFKTSFIMRSCQIACKIIWAKGFSISILRLLVTNTLSLRTATYIEKWKMIMFPFSRGRCRTKHFSKDTKHRSSCRRDSVMLLKTPSYNYSCWTDVRVAYVMHWRRFDFARFPATVKSSLRSKSLRRLKTEKEKDLGLLSWIQLLNPNSKWRGSTLKSTYNGKQTISLYKSRNCSTFMGSPLSLKLWLGKV